jgi:hypothetical protein
VLIEAVMESVESEAFAPASLDLRYNSIPHDLKDPFVVWCKEYDISLRI